MELAAPHMGGGRRLFLWALAASLCVTAAIAIATLLFAQFDETARRILATTALLSLASLLSLPAGVLLDRRRAVPLAWATIAASAAGFALAMIVIWGLREEESLARLSWTFWLGAGAGAQASAVTAMLQTDSRRLRVVCVLSILLASLLAALIAIAVWIEPDVAAYFRATGAVAVAAVLTSLLQPILRRVERPVEVHAQLVLELDREPSEEAVAAAIEALERHGIRADRR